MLPDSVSVDQDGGPFDLIGGLLELLLGLVLEVRLGLKPEKE